MKKSKLKAKIANLEAEKAKLKKDIYILVDTINESKIDSLKDHYRFIRKMHRELTNCVMFGSTRIKLNGILEQNSFDIFNKTDDGFDEDGCMRKFTNY